MTEIKDKSANCRTVHDLLVSIETEIKGLHCKICAKKYFVKLKSEIE